MVQIFGDQRAADATISHFDNFNIFSALLFTPVYGAP